jgi:hypothetical protein
MAKTPYRHRRPSGLKFIIAAAIIGVAWLVFVLLSGSLPYFFQAGWKFEQTGQFGDSFGVLSAGMAAAAAYFAYQTYRQAADENERLLRRQDAQDRTAKRERAELLERQNLSDMRANVPAFLALLEGRYAVLNQATYVLKNLKTVRGHEAITSISYNLRFDRERLSGPAKDIYENIVLDARGLENLFRYTYHLVLYADREFGGSGLRNPKETMSYTYVRLLRAQLSNDELLVLALNCVDGPGKPYFKELAERYSLFHNMDAGDIKLFRLKTRFDATAFGRR